MGRTSYVVALGSNRQSRYGSPRRTVLAAARTLRPDKLSSIHLTPALGPAGRSFANAALILSSPLSPPDFLIRLKQIEAEFGRRAGRRWGPRVLDLDIILWSGGAWVNGGLTVPHSSYRERLFVLEPLVEVAPDWRDPVSGLSVRHLLTRARRRPAVDPCPARP